MSDTEDACYIFCSKCELEIMVSPEKWERIEKRQKILRGEKPLYRFSITVSHKRKGSERVVSVKGHHLEYSNESVVVIDGIEITFGLFEYVSQITTYAIN